MTNYPVGDYLIQVKNAAKAGKRELVTKSSKFVYKIALKLKDMNILEKVELKDGQILSRITYHRKAPLLMDLKLVSKPGLRKYMAVEEIEVRKRKSASLLMISSPLGVITSKEALIKRVGGEVIAEVW